MCQLVNTGDCLNTRVTIETFLWSLYNYYFIHIGYLPLTFSFGGAVLHHLMKLYNDTSQTNTVSNTKLHPQDKLLLVYSLPIYVPANGKVLT